LSEEIEALEAQLETLQRVPVSTTANERSVQSQVPSRADLEALGEGVVRILDGLGLSKPRSMLSKSLSELSGGWRMRAVLAQALVHINEIDVLLLDEPTNHLDLPSIAWLQRYLIGGHGNSDLVVLFVSHDRAFLSGLASDLIILANQSLSYYAGGYEDYLRTQEELTLRKQHLLDAQQRQTTHLQKTLAAARDRGDERTTKTKQKKLERVNLTRGLDNHKFKLFSATSLDEKGVHMPTAIDSLAGELAARDYRLVKMKLPVPDVGSLRLASGSAPVITLDCCALSYSSALGSGQGSGNVVQEVTAQVTLASRIGIIGRNGQGKSTLLSLLYGNTSHYQDCTTGNTNGNTTGKKKGSGGLRVVSHTGNTTSSLPVPPVTNGTNGNGMIPPAPSSNTINTSSNSGGTSSGNTGKVCLVSGTMWRHHQLRTGMVGQHQIDLLQHHLARTPVAYLQHLLDTSSEPRPGDLGKSEMDLRAHLGMFGLSGGLALQPVGSLSGGQKARLSLAAACLFRPHVLLLDEPSNHLSMDSIEALIQAAGDSSPGHWWSSVTICTSCGVSVGSSGWCEMVSLPSAPYR